MLWTAVVLTVTTGVQYVQAGSRATRMTGVVVGNLSPAVRCEVVAVGTELLLGQIVDTNSAWIGEQLALAGIDVNFGSTVGDNLDRIVSALRIALDRNDAVLVCGGLGPDAGRHHP